MKLLIGNKNYSSWSLRPWIALKVAGIPFEEQVVSLDDAQFKQTVAAISPAGKVPALADGEVRVWESLAILEYVAEKFPDAHLWPADPQPRAHARAIAAEMHAGFASLRNECPMNFWRPVKKRELSPDAAANVARIDALWIDCRTRFGNGGPFLFGAFTAADAMYAPVVSRFETYAIEVGPLSKAYMEKITALPAWTEWKRAALRERWVLPKDEPDWPIVLKA